MLASSTSMGSVDERLAPAKDSSPELIWVGSFEARTLSARSRMPGSSSRACNAIESRDLPLAVEVVAGLKDRAQRIVASVADRSTRVISRRHEGRLDSKRSRRARARSGRGRGRSADRGRLRRRAARRGRALRRLAVQLAEPAVERRRPAPECACDSVSSALATLTSSPARDCVGTLARIARTHSGRLPRPLGGVRGRTAPRPGRWRRSAGRRPVRPAPGRRRPPRSGGSRRGRGPSGSVSTRTSTSWPRKSSSERSAAFWPASSPSKTSTTRSARRRRAGHGRRPGPCPRVPTTFARPTWCAAITSVYPSTTRRPSPLRGRRRRARSAA